MNWRKTAFGTVAVAWLGLATSPASGGLETFANYTNASSSYTTNTFAGQDGSTWTVAACRGDIAVNGKAATIRNVVNAYIRSGTVTGGLGTLTFKYRKPFTGTTMSNKVLVVGSAGTYTNYVSQVPSTTNEVLVFTAADVNIEGDFALVITNTASSARISVDDIEWTAYSAGGGTAPEFGANPGPLGATTDVAMAFTVSATGSPAPALALQAQTASSGYSFAAGTGVLSYTPPAGDLGARTFTFTASNSVGVATQTVSVAVTNAPATAPAFGANPGPVSATATVATVFTVSATGVPTPALSLQSQSASAGYSFAAGTGQLSYTPPTNDVGARTFTFAASNSAGVALQTVAVSVASAPANIPTVSVTNIDTDSFTVNWTACAGASNYQIQVATDTNFTGGGSGSNAIIASVGNTGVSNGWAYVNGASNSGTYHKLVAATAPGVVSPEFSTLAYVAVTAGYAVATFGGAGANELLISYSLDGGTNWVVFGTNTSATSSTYVTGQTQALPAAALGQAGVRIKWHCDVATAALGIRLQSLVLSGVQSDGEGSLVADATVAALTYAATGLVIETTYRVRARKEGGEWSSIVSATTASPTPAAPAFGTNPGPVGATTGVARAFTVSATGYPAPALALEGATASGGYSFAAGTGVLTYTAPEADVGTQTFTFTAGNAMGVATQVVEVAVSLPPATLPTFGANPGPLGATAGVARAFTVSATGYPAPALSLEAATASAGYSFAAGTGVLTYTPPPNDVGARTFTFAASNGAGVALQTVTVSVASYIPLVAVTNIGTNFFTINWTEATGATTYQVQVGTDTNFTAATFGSNVINQTFATLTDTTPPSGWTSSASIDLDNTTYYGAASPSFKFNTGGQTLTSPAFAAGATNLQFWAYGRNGSGSTLAISGLVSGVWTLIDTVSVARNGATYNVPLNPQTTQIKFAFTKIVTVYLDDVAVQTATAAGSLVLDQSVAALTYGATGLDIQTLYYVRVRATTGAWSSVVSATTLNTDPVAPWFTGGMGPYGTTAGVARAFTVAAMGTPAPTLALQGATAAAGSYAFTTNTGYFIYTPPLGDTGTQTFTFTASNSSGVATQAVQVAVAAATVPVFTSGASYGATTLVTRVLNVEASGAPAPTLALAGTTASLNSYSFSPELGRLSYTPPANDVGTQTFTFTAGNLAGVATQTVSVVVSNMPAVAPTMDALPAQTTMVGLEFSETVTATDPDTAASNLTFACTSAVAPATWAFDTNSGYFVFIPTTNQIGANVFSFRATDHPTLLTSPWSNLVVVVSAAGDPVSVSFGSARIVGEEGAGTLLIPVNLAYSGSASMQLRFSGPTNGTALRGVDFNCATTLVISGASSGTLALELANDVLPEGPESVKITLVPVAPATAGAITQTVVHLRDDDTVAIMAANITSGANQEYESPGNRIFQALCPDVALVQEFNMTNGTTEAVYRSWVDQTFGTNFSYCHEPLASANIPNGIVSRWPIVEYGEWDDTTLTDRDFVWAKIDLPGDKFLYAVSLHIKASSGYESQRTTETRALTNYIAQAGWSTNDYLVIGGDFNLQVRTETALAVLTAKVVSDAHQSADQVGNKNTNSGRDNPYDLVLPSPYLDGRHRTFYFGGYAYANGIVYDTRIAWASGLPSPSLSADSAAVNMQHMGALKVFELEKDDAVDAPAAFSATPAGATRIDLAFTPNALGDDVVVVWDTDGTFTAPAGTAPAVGASFAGGTVAYKGGVSSPSHTGLTSCATYYYKCWSYAGTVYSTNGLTAGATTAEPAAPASIWASATNNEAFTAAWSAVAGATGYRLDVCAAPSFSGAGSGWGPIFRETMGTPTAGTTLLADHEATGGFDNDAYAMTSAGADNPADVRTSSASTNYVDPEGQAASGGANIFFPSNGLSGTVGFGIAGIDTRGYEALSLSFAYRKESAVSNMLFDVEWSANGGGTWNAIAVSNLPAANAAINWYLISNLTINAAALGTTNLSLRWTRADGSVPGRVDDVLVRGFADSAEFVSGYSNRTVTGATSQSVTGLTGDVTYYFRVAAAGGCAGAFSRVVGVTPAGTPAAPVFAANPGPLAATTGVTTVFAVATAGGFPQPGLALQSATASGGYSFAPGTGQLTYAPPEADVGARTFTFRATNSMGTATQIVAVNVSAGIPSAPASVWASATNITGFTANWSASSLATGYRLDVSADAGFQVGGDSVQAVLASNEATDVSLIAGDWSGTALAGTNGYVLMLQATSEIVSPAFSTAGSTNLTVDFAARTYGGATSSNITVSISTNNGGTWSTLAVVNPPSGSAWVAMPALATAAHLGHAQTRIRWQSLDANGSSGVGIRYLVAKGARPGFTPSFVAGCSNLAVSGTSRVVTGLAANATYYFRVRAENAGGSGTNSATASATTLPKSNQTISFPAFGDQLATNAVELSATASSGLAVSFAVGGGPATIANGTTLTFSGAGTVRIVASQAGDGAWNAAPNVTNTFAVTKATAGVTLGSLLQTYDGSAKSATATTVPAGLPVDLTYDGSDGAPTAVGSYAVTGTVNHAMYQGSAAGTLAISKAVAGVTLGDLTQAYDGTARMASAITAPAGLTVVFTYDGRAWAPTNVGSYAVTGTVSDANYAGSAAGVLVVSKAVAGVTLGSLSQTYDGSAKSATATTEPAGLTVEFTYDGGAAVPTAAGSYAVTGTVNEANYAGSASGTLVISKASATVALGGLAQTYDGSAKSATATTTPEGLAVVFTYDGQTWAPTNAGSYAVTGAVNEANYAGSAFGTLVISKASATVALGGLAQTYDGSAKSATATTTPEGLAVVFTYDGHAWAPTNAGSYAVTGAVNEINYAGSASDELIISRGAQTIDFPPIGDQLATNTVALSATADSGLAVGFAVASGPASISGGNNLAFSGAGEVVLVASQAGDGNWNAAPDATNVFNVGKAAAAVTLGNLTQSYDGTAKSATATTEPAGLAVDLTYDGHGWAPTNAGSYAVTGTVNEALYQGSATGVLMISQASESAIVTLEGLAQTYDGTPRIVTASTEPEGLEVEITYAGSPTAPTNAGSYAVTGAVRDVNYAGFATGTLVVAKAAAVVTLGDLAQTYDGLAKSATATTTPEGLAVVFTYDGQTWAPTNAGSYAVTGTVNDANYAGSSAGTLVVAKAAATVALSDLEHIYDGSPKSATATTTPEGLAVSITYAGAATPPSATGSYAVVAAILEANYAGATNGTLVIAAALTPFESWLQGRALDPGDVRFAQGADDDRDGRTTWEEYVADTDPAASNSVLALSGAYVIGTKTTNGTGQIRVAFPASSNRFYRLEYCTRLTNAATVGAIDLGRGVPGMVITNGATGTWYGVIRVRVDP